MRSLKYKKPDYFPLLERIMFYLPSGGFYYKEISVIPYKMGKTTFIVNTEYVSKVHYLMVGETIIHSFVPDTEETEISVVMKQGIYEVSVLVEFPEGKRTIIQETFNVSLLATLYLSAVLEFRWDWSDVILVGQSLRSRFNLTRFEIHIPNDLRDLFQRDATRHLAIRRLIFAQNHKFSTAALSKYTGAICGTLPCLEPIEYKDSDFNLDFDHWFSGQDQVSGQYVHVWTNTSDETRQGIFLKMINNLSETYTPNEVTDQITVFENRDSYGM